MCLSPYGFAYEQSTESPNTVLLPPAIQIQHHPFPDIIPTSQELIESESDSDELKKYNHYLQTCQSQNSQNTHPANIKKPNFFLPMSGLPLLQHPKIYL